MGTELARSSGSVVAERLLSPSLANFVKLSERALCRMVGGKGVEDGQIAALVCASEGITPMEFARTYHVIMGKPAMKSDAMLAAWRTRGGDHELIEQSPTRAAIRLIDEKGRVNDFSLSWSAMTPGAPCAEESRFPWNDWRDHAQGLKDNWATPLDRQNMLWARCVSNAVRTLKPEIVSGIYTPEEMMDIEGEVVTRQVSPAQTAEQVIAALADAEALAAAPDEKMVVIKDEVIELLSTYQQHERIRELYADCGITQEQQAAALTKRGVNALSSLTADQANEIITKLEEYQKKITQDSLPTGAAPRSTTATS